MSTVQAWPEPEPDEDVRVTPLVVSPRAVVATLAAAAFLLAVAGVVTQYLVLGADVGGAGGRISTPVARLFALDGEGTIPAWFQGALILFSAGLFWVASGARRADHPHHANAWRWLAVIFVLLSCDEIASAHETFGFWLAPRVGGTIGVYAWLLAGVPFVAFVGFALRGFLRDLPRSTRRGLLAAGALYLAGAVGIEAYEAVIDAQYYGTFTFAVVTTIEESFEAAGLIVLIGTLLGHLRGAPPVPLETRA